MMAPEAEVTQKPPVRPEDQPDQDRPVVSAPVPPTAIELLCVALIVLTADLTLWRGHGYSGYAAFFAVVPTLLYLGSKSAGTQQQMLTRVGICLAAVAVRLVWQGTLTAAACGWGCLFAFAAALSGRIPYVFETIQFAAQSWVAGYAGLDGYGRRLIRKADNPERGRLLSVLMPATALVVFGGIFVMANPDLVTAFWSRASRVIDSLRDFLTAVSPGEVIFCITALWLAVGLIRPKPATDNDESDDRPAEQGTDVNGTALIPAFRNTLVTVVVLFTGYLVFEFRTLWFHEFPPEFFRSGRVHKYAHEGAAWLTLALALATAVLSLIFRGAVMQDQRVHRLKHLAWIWSALNGLLAVTVYHRLFIYIGYNGMTRMRTVGLLGISCVVVGFVLVLRRISAEHRFLWLVRRQLWTVTLFVLLYALLPVDYLAHSWNVRQVLAGNLPPIVQVSEQPLSDEALLTLPPLLNSDNEIIRDGVAAILSERIRAAQNTTTDQHWTAFRLATDLLLRQLQSPDVSTKIRDANRPFTSRQRLHDFAWQWY